MADIKELEGVQAALLAVPTRSVPEHAARYLAMGINTVDSYNIHGSLADLRRELDAVAKASKALSVTIPAGMGIHKRAEYIELEPGYEFEAVAEAIRSDEYFKKDETRVQLVESVDALIDMGHGVLMERKGVSGATDNQLFKFDMRINNPALTAQVMVASVRAAARQQPGCYTMVEIPIIDYLPGDRDSIIRRLV